MLFAQVFFPLQSLFLLRFAFQPGLLLRGLDAVHHLVRHWEVGLLLFLPTLLLHAHLLVAQAHQVAEQVVAGLLRLRLDASRVVGLRLVVRLGVAEELTHRNGGLTCEHAIQVLQQLDQTEFLTPRVVYALWPVNEVLEPNSVCVFYVIYDVYYFLVHWFVQVSQWSFLRVVWGDYKFESYESLVLVTR